ncbi:MAG: hypothetical protein LUQ50_04580 [Methanospirillum sp.]|uniref:hypothetical protein n=1 Tax=Methanospirillum sp. TaxID=45200 RepID=UPI00236BAFD7|nr:hypothetical protein [Methanospirillum sp.]MDD1728332.1 hypothetical protein [Methanospirillum sp.]
MEIKVPEVNLQYKKYTTPKVLPLNPFGDEHTCSGGAGDIGCGAGSCAARDCVTNGAGAQVARSDIIREDN